LNWVAGIYGAIVMIIDHGFIVQGRVKTASKTIAFVIGTYVVVITDHWSKETIAGVGIAHVVGANILIVADLGYLATHSVGSIAFAFEAVHLRAHNWHRVQAFVTRDVDVNASSWRNARVSKARAMEIAVYG